MDKAEALRDLRKACLMNSRFKRADGKICLSVYEVIADLRDFGYYLTVIVMEIQCYDQSAEALIRLKVRSMFAHGVHGKLTLVQSQQFSFLKIIRRRNHD